MCGGRTNTETVESNLNSDIIALVPIWISVNDKLPELIGGRKPIVPCINLNINTLFLAHYDPDTHGWISGGKYHMPITVTHWIQIHPVPFNEEVVEMGDPNWAGLYT